MQGKTVLWLYEYLKKAGANATLMHLPHEETNEKLGTDVHFNTLMLGPNLTALGKHCRKFAHTLKKI